MTMVFNFAGLDSCGLAACALPVEEWNADLIAAASNLEPTISVWIIW